MPVKRKPTRKQLAARKKFVKMVRARARASRAAKRNAGAKSVTRHMTRTAAPSRKRATARNARKAITVVKNGRRLHGAAAQAVINARKKNSGKRAGTLLSGRKKNSGRKVVRLSPSKQGGVHRRTRAYKRVGNKGFWSGQIKRAVGRRLHAPIRRRRNQSSAIEEVHQRFLGRPIDNTFEIEAPDGTPKDVVVMPLTLLVTDEGEEFAFKEGEAFLGIDTSDHLHVLGDIHIESNADLGHIEEVRYVAQKDHLNPGGLHIRGSRRRRRRNSTEPIEYYHYFGEEGGTLPKLKTDDEGMLHIVGGSYTIEPEGITD
jgi:hypothetical protein